MHVAMSHVTRHTSHVTRYTSHVTRHTSHVTWYERTGMLPEEFAAGEMTALKLLDDLLYTMVVCP